MSIFINCAVIDQKYFDRNNIKTPTKSVKDFINEELEKLSYDSLFSGTHNNGHLVFSEKFEDLLKILNIEKKTKQINVNSTDVYSVCFYSVNLSLNKEVYIECAVDLNGNLYAQKKDDSWHKVDTLVFFSILRSVCDNQFRANEKELHELNMISKILNKDTGIIKMYYQLQPPIDITSIINNYKIEDFEVKLRSNIKDLMAVFTDFITKYKDEISEYKPKDTLTFDNIFPDTLDLDSKKVIQTEVDEILNKSKYKAKEKTIAEYSKEDYETDLTSMFELFIKKYYTALDAIKCEKLDSTKTEKTFATLLKDFISKKKEELTKQNTFLMPPKSNMLLHGIWFLGFVIFSIFLYIYFSKTDEFEELDLEDTEINNTSTNNTSMVSQSAIEASA